MGSKVVLLTEYFPPHPGGTPRWFYNLYRRLRRWGVTIVTRYGAGVSSGNVRVRTVPWQLDTWTLFKPKNWLEYYKLVAFTLKIARDVGADCIHAGRCIPEGIVCWVLKHLWEIPYVCFVHGEDIEIAWRCWEYYLLVKPVLRHADLIIANSRFTRQLLVSKWRVPTARVWILHPGTDSTYFRPDAAHSRRDSFTILCSGRFQRRKGQDVLLRAVALLRDKMSNLRCIFAGSGEDRVYLRSLAEELGVTNQVAWCEFPSDGELLELYRAADLVALPNREVNGDCEGFGIVLLEAQACGKPVVCGDSGGTRETLLPGRSGIVVDCTDAVRLADAIFRLYQNRQSLPYMGQVARRWVERYFDWNVLLAKADILMRRGVSESASQKAAEICS